MIQVETLNYCNLMNGKQIDETNFLNRKIFHFHQSLERSTYSEIPLVS